jgi:hypothetical protein
MTPEIAGAKRKLEDQATSAAVPNWARQLLEYIAALEAKTGLTFPNHPVMPRTDAQFDGSLLARVKLRRGSDQMRRLRGERPQDDPWPWIHEGELIAEVERLQPPVKDSEHVHFRCGARVSCADAGCNVHAAGKENG